MATALLPRNLYAARSGVHLGVYRRRVPSNHFRSAERAFRSNVVKRGQGFLSGGRFPSVRGGAARGDMIRREEQGVKSARVSKGFPSNRAETVLFRVIRRELIKISRSAGKLAE